MSVLQENRKQILTDKDSIARVSEDDLSKCLKTLSCVFEEFGSENMALEQFYIIDKTQVKHIIKKYNPYIKVAECLSV